jgi:protein-tyrosine phosphatase
VIRRRLVQVRDRLDQATHGTRQRRVSERLEASEATNLLFLCLGNVCRSPYAERIATIKGSGALAVESAGFIKPGRPPPDSALDAARARKIHHGDHRSRVVTADMLARADAIFLFDRYNVQRLRGETGVLWSRVYWLGDFDPRWTGKRAIIDPWGRSLEEFDETFARIERCVGAALNVL